MKKKDRLYLVLPFANPVIHKDGYDEEYGVKRGHLMDLTRTEGNNAFCNVEKFYGKVKRIEEEFHLTSDIYRLVALSEDPKIVTLNCGGPPLNVICVEGENVFVTWNDKNGKKWNQSFPLACVKECVPLTENTIINPPFTYEYSPGVDWSGKPMCPKCSNTRGHNPVFEDRYMKGCERCGTFFKIRKGE